MARSDRDLWSDRYERKIATASPLDPPAAFLVENEDLLTPGRTLDLAAGRGRNSTYLASRGHDVVAVDAAKPALGEIRRANLKIDVVQMDLDHPGFRPASFDNAVCFNFLDRRLFPALLVWLRPGGVFVVDTFLVDQAEFHRPRRPELLLGHNELLRLLSGYRVLRYREGRVRDGDKTFYRAGAVAARP